MKKKKALFIDDEEINLFVFEKVYAQDMEVLTANNGDDARSILESNADDLDIVVSDFIMPNEKGLEILQSLKEYKKDLTCYLLTGYESTPEILDSMKSGLVKKVFKKPVNFKELQSELTGAPA